MWHVKHCKKQLNAKVVITSPSREYFTLNVFGTLNVTDIAQCKDDEISASRSLSATSDLQLHNYDNNVITSVRRSPLLPFIQSFESGLMLDR